MAQGGPKLNRLTSRETASTVAEGGPKLNTLTSRETASTLALGGPKLNTLTSREMASLVQACAGESSGVRTSSHSGNRPAVAVAADVRRLQLTRPRIPKELLAWRNPVGIEHRTELCSRGFMRFGFNAGSQSPGSRPRLWTRKNPWVFVQGPVDTATEHGLATSMNAQFVSHLAPGKAHGKPGTTRFGN